MKKAIFTLILAVASLAACAQVSITRVDKIAPTDEVFMDMAVTAAQTSVSDGGSACGTVVILNGAWRATGRATAGTTAEEAAIAKSRLSSLENATIYTINEPTTAAYNAIARSGCETVYFVNPREAVIAAGLYPASAYDDSKVDASLPKVELRQINYKPATDLIKK